jgi:hypothetical protein
MQIREFQKGGSIMKHLTDIFMGLLVATVMLAFSNGAVMAQEKAKAAPAKETKAPGPTVVFENERVRVTEGRIKPGEKNEMMARGDRINIAIKAAKTRVHYPDGKKEDRDRKAGSVSFNKAGTSSTENIGKTETHSVIVTLK